MTHPLRKVLYEETGYYDGLNLAPEEHRMLVDIVTEQYLNRIRSLVPEYYDEFAGRSIDRYHELSHLLNHSEDWQVGTRRLPPEAVEKVRGSELFEELHGIFGPIGLTDQAGQGWPIMDWRLVRPGEPNDVGPLHSDRWYWDITHAAIPPGTKRLNAWIALCTEPGKYGLRIAPGTQIGEPIGYHTTHDRLGDIRPVIEAEEDELDLRQLECAPGNVVLFHEHIIHNGAVNRGSTCRVSLEFTMLIDESW